jgi:hypothetical protein
MTCDLEEYLVQDTESESSPTCINLCLRKAAESTGTSLRFAVYIETNVGSQVRVIVKICGVRNSGVNDTSPLCAVAFCAFYVPYIIGQ